MENKKNKLPKWLIIVIASVLLFYVGLIGFFVYIGTSEFETYTIKEKGNIVEVDKGKLSVDKTFLEGEYIEDKSSSENDKYVVFGYLKNNSDKKYYSVRVGIKLYDKNNTVLDVIYATITELEAKETWKFVVTYEGQYAKDVATYKIVSIDPWSYYD